MKREPFVPLDKQSKKKRKAYHQMKRGSWGQVVPVTRVMKNKKAYDRKERRREERGLSGTQEKCE